MSYKLPCEETADYFEDQARRAHQSGKRESLIAIAEKNFERRRGFRASSTREVKNSAATSVPATQPSELTGRLVARSYHPGFDVLVVLVQESDKAGGGESMSQPTRFHDKTPATPVRNAGWTKPFLKFPRNSIRRRTDPETRSGRVLALSGD